MPRSFLGLLVIAGLIALPTVLVLLAIGEDVTVDAASTGAVFGSLAVVLAWPLLRAARRRRTVDNSG